MQPIHQSPLPTLQTPTKSPSNPLQSIRKFKQLQQQILIMQKRTSIIQRQNQYNKYKTIQHQNKMQRHTYIHQQLVKEKDQLNKSLKAIRDISEVRAQVGEMKKKLREGMGSAKGRIYGKNKEMALRKNNQSVLFQKEIMEKKEMMLEENKKQREMVRKQKQERVGEKLLVSRLANIGMGKTIQSQHMSARIRDREKQLRRLQMIEQGLVKDQEKSVQSSRVVRQNYGKISNPQKSVKMRGKKGSQSQSGKSKDLLDIVMV